MDSKVAEALAFADRPTRYVATAPTPTVHAVLDTLAAEVRRLQTLSPAAMLDEFERRTRTLPLGHEDKGRGASSYNWRMAHLKELRALAAGMPGGGS